jgi:integrase
MSRALRQRAGSLTFQVNRLFAAAHAVGQSKHDAKRAGDDAWQSRVFALRTDWNYRDATLYFARWARERHGCYLVADAVKHAEWGREWSAELAERGLAASTRKAYLSGVAKACAVAAPELRPKWADVIADVGRRTPPPPRGYGEHAEQVIAAVAVSSPEAGLVLETILETGARIGELVRTDRAGDHHLTPDKLRGAGAILLTGKGGLERLITVSHTLYERLVAQAGDRDAQQALFSVSDRDVQRELRAACARLGMPATGPHGLRYDFAARLRDRLLSSGWSESEADCEVSRQLGHRRAEITRHYLRTA